MGAKHPDFKKAHDFLHEMRNCPEWEEAATFYLDAAQTIRREIEAVFKEECGFAQSLKDLSEWLAEKENRAKTEEIPERMYAVFFPEASGIQSAKTERIEALRKKRTVRVAELNSNRFGRCPGEARELCLRVTRKSRRSYQPVSLLNYL